MRQNLSSPQLTLLCTALCAAKADVVIARGWKKMGRELKWKGKRFLPFPGGHSIKLLLLLHWKHTVQLGIISFGDWDNALAVKLLSFCSAAKREGWANWKIIELLVFKKRLAQCRSMYKKCVPSRKLWWKTDPEFYNRMSRLFFSTRSGRTRGYCHIASHFSIRGTKLDPHFNSRPWLKRLHSFFDQKCFVCNCGGESWSQSIDCKDFFQMHSWLTTREMRHLNAEWFFTTSVACT